MLQAIADNATRRILLNICDPINHVASYKLCPAMCTSQLPKLTHLHHDLHMAPTTSPLKAPTAAAAASVVMEGDSATAGAAGIATCNTPGACPCLSSCS